MAVAGVEFFHSDLLYVAAMLRFGSPSYFFDDTFLRRSISFATSACFLTLDSISNKSYDEPYVNDPHGVFVQGSLVGLVGLVGCCGERLSPWTTADVIVGVQKEK